VIPTYNRADVLPRAIHSVICQTLTNFELIIVDDGSQDNTREAVNQFSDPRIRYIKQKNQGANAARNHGVRKAAGKYISFLDSDDEFREGYLQTIVKLMENQGLNCIGAFTSHCRITEENITHVSTADKQKVTFKNIKKKNTIGGFSAATFRASVFQQIGYLDEQLQCAQDYDFYVRALHKGGYIIGINKPLVNMYIGENRISENIKRKKEGLKRVTEKHGEILAPSRIADHHVMIGFLYAKNGNLRSARQELWRAIRIYPYHIFTYYHLIFSYFGVFIFNKSLKFKKYIEEIFT
jgi:glycosyltransferase involved in cell wall biosynthesis